MKKSLLISNKDRVNLYGGDSPRNVLKTDSTTTAKNDKKFCKKDHQCKLCGLYNSNAWSLTLHMKRHNKEKEFKVKCEICSSLFINNYELSTHMNSKHIRGKKYKCRFCTKMFINYSTKYCHEDTHGLLQHKCKFCEEIFSTQVKKRKHQREVHRTDQRSCKYCLKNFASNEFLKSHISTYHIKTVTCSACDKLFFDKNELQEHKKELHKVEKVRNTKRITKLKCNERNLYEDVDLKVRTYVLRCRICSEEFDFKVDLNSHIERVHPMERSNIFKFSCTLCNKSFESKNNLKTHMIGHGPKIQCPHCDHKTARGQDLARHIRRMHDSEKPFKCSMCSESFPNLNDFVLHKMKHGKVRFQCDICGKFYSQKNLLGCHRKKKHHKKISTTCGQCGKQLVNPVLLKRHVQICHRTPDASCLCNCCGVMIKIKDISNHILNCPNTPQELLVVKSKMKGPSCDFCYITFSTHFAALYHYKEFHPSSIYSCKYCHMNFISIEIRKKHEFMHEEIIMKRLSASRHDFKIYECFACGESFTVRKDLSDHHEAFHFTFKWKPLTSGNTASQFATKRTSFDKKEYYKIKLKPIRDNDFSENLSTRPITKVGQICPTDLENNIQQDVLESHRKKSLQNNNLNKNNLVFILDSDSKFTLSTGSSIILTNNDNASENQMIELLEQKPVSGGGSTFLPLNELLKKLKLFTCMEVNELKNA